jgi:hypothetical protein
MNRYCTVVVFESTDQPHLSPSDHSCWAKGLYENSRFAPRVVHPSSKPDTRRSGISWDPVLSEVFGETCSVDLCACCESCDMVKDQVMKEYLDHKRLVMCKPMQKVAAEQYVALLRHSCLFGLAFFVTPGTLLKMFGGLVHGANVRSLGKGSGAPIPLLPLPLMTQAAPWDDNNITGISVEAPLSNPSSAELSHSLQVLDRGRNTPKPTQNPGRTLCAGLWVPHLVCVAGFGQVWGAIWVDNRR